MGKCKDCLHYNACSNLFKIVIGREPTADGNNAEVKCQNYKDRTKFEEVVRCKDCKRCGFCGDATNLEVMGFYGYCSRGERRQP